MKILIVDDDRQVRELIRDVITDFGLKADVIQISFGLNGQDAWREFQANQSDLVITDLRMETKDAGFELAKKIKTLSPGTPVIMITADDFEPPKEAVDCVMGKPFDAETLMRKIKQLTGGDYAQGSGY